MNVHGVVLESDTVDVRVRGARVRGIRAAGGLADARVGAFARYAGALASEVQSTTQAAVR